MSVFRAQVGGAHLRALPAPRRACPPSGGCRIPSPRCGRRCSITKSMSCSTSRMLMPSARSWRSTSAKRLLLLMAQARGRLVEQQQRRVGAQGARDLQQALLARSPGCRRARAGSRRMPMRCNWRSASAKSALPRRGRGAAWRAIAPLCGRADGRRARRSPAPSCPRTIFTCWKVRGDAARGDLAGGQAADGLAAQAHGRRGSGPARR